MKTIGAFYKEKILSLPKKTISKRELPSNSDDVKVEKDLFGWKVIAGKNHIVCRSDVEARYLKVFIDAGMMEIFVPKDDKYLHEILPELERLKSRIDEIIDSYIDGILDRKIREQVRNEVYIEITK
ncbi:MAG TPA: hypothetical protein VF399_07380 [bacterium]